MQQTGTWVVAAFDFDGTLTRRRHSLLPFLHFLCGPRALARTLTAHGGKLGAGVALDVFDAGARRARAKEDMLRDLLLGRRHEDVWDAGDAFARRLAAGPGLRPELVSRLRWHREQGHEILIVSASLEAYVEPFATALGGAHVLATKLRNAPDGTLTGELDGVNCRGAEKVRRLREWGLSPDIELWAYGDSSGDRELLQAAHVPHRVGRGARCPTPPS